MFDDQPSGFEFYFDTAENAFGDRPDALGDRTHAVTFATHSKMHELVCALYAAGALARITDGLLFDGESGDFLDSERILVLAKTIGDAEL